VIRKYTAKLILEAGTLSDYKESSYTVEELEVAAENDKYIIIDDWYFSRVCKESKHNEHQHCVEKPRTNVFTISKGICGEMYGTGASYTLYTYGTKRPATIRKAIEKAIQDEYGAFMGKVDLGFIK